MKNGVFSVLLGSVNPIPDTVFTGEPRYLATKIGSDPEMKPLRPMASVPYALYAFKSLGGKGDGDWFVNGNDMYSIPSGKVGIGTTAPTAGLDVKHSSNTEYALKVYNNGGQALGVEVTGGANSATPLLNVHSDYSGGDRQGLWVQSNGNVGIGTTNPQGLLQVGEPFIVTSDEDVGISHPGSPEYTPDAKLEIVTDAVKDFLMLSSTNANSANGDRFIVKNDGNVGIGTATPNNKLTVFQETEVQASTYPGAKISVRQMNGEPEYGHPEKNYALELNDRSTGSTAGAAMKLSSGDGPIANIYSTANVDGYGGSLVFQTSPDHSNLFDRVTINSTGYVGIGTTTPMNKLDVEGGVAVGTGYSGTNTAPTNGMIVEGNVGIGTTVPAAKLHIGDPFTPGPAPSNIGVLAKIAGPTSPALGSATKWGMVGYAETGGVLGSGNMYGIYGITYGTDNLSVGVYGEGGGGASWAGKFRGKVYAAEVAIGTTTPMNMLDVEGSVAVGAGYSGTNTAPTNGMIVEGNVGIGTASPASKLEVAGTVHSSSGGFKFPDGTIQTTAAGASVPSGVIVMWSGTLATIPPGWALCNGTNGTPDLRDRFIYGCSAGQNPGATGGSSSHNHIIDIDPFLSAYFYGSTVGSDINYPAATSVDHRHQIDPPPTTSSSSNHLPPYYKLAFIMKL